MMSFKSSSSPKCQLHKAWQVLTELKRFRDVSNHRFALSLAKRLCYMLPNSQSATLSSEDWTNKTGDDSRSDLACKKAILFQSFYRIIHFNGFRLMALFDIAQCKHNAKRCKAVVTMIQSCSSI